jgi:hypothetical protein
LFLFCSNGFPIRKAMSSAPLAGRLFRPSGESYRTAEQTAAESILLADSTPIHLLTTGTIRETATAMPTAQFLRRQAQTCLRIARTCFDLASAERMRQLAGELNAAAAQIERQHQIAPHTIGWDVPSHPAHRDY